MINWICEFCFKVIEEQIDLPSDWHIVLQSCICPECWKKIKDIPDFEYFIPGGAFANGKPDPRERNEI